MNWSKISGNCFSWRSSLGRFRILWAHWRLWFINSWSQGPSSLWWGSFLALDRNWGSLTSIRISTRFLVAGNSTRDLVMLQSLSSGVCWFNLVLDWRRSLSSCSSELYWCLFVVRLISKLYWWAAFTWISRIFGLMSCLLSMRNFFRGLWFFLSTGRFFAALLSWFGSFLWWAFSLRRLALPLRNLALVVRSEIFLILRVILFFLLHLILLWIHSRHHERIISLLIWHLLWNILLCLHLSHLVELENLLLELRNLAMHIVDVWVDWSTL